MLLDLRSVTDKKVRTGKKKNLHLSGRMGLLHNEQIWSYFTGLTGQVNQLDLGYCSIDRPTSNGDF